MLKQILLYSTMTCNINILLFCGLMHSNFRTLQKYLFYGKELATHTIKDIDNL